MPKGPQGQKRPADTVANAIRVAKILTGEVEEDTGADDGKDKGAQAMGRKGGAARRDKLSPEREADRHGVGRIAVGFMLIRLCSVFVIPCVRSSSKYAGLR